MSYNKIDLFNSDSIELAPQVIDAETPKPQDARLRDPELLRNRLDGIAEPGERLRLFLKTIFIPEFDGSHESFHIYKSAILAGSAGWLFGGFIKSKGHHEDFVRRHNAAAFKSSHQANRARVDTYLYSVATRGLKMGIGCFLLVFSSGVISMGSINYRDNLYLPDWIIGYGALGAVSRLWLGTRGIIAGGLMGVGAGLLGYGVIRALENATGESVPQWRYRFHDEYMRKRQAKRDMLLRLSQDRARDKYSDME